VQRRDERSSGGAPDAFAAWPRVCQQLHLLDLFEMEMLNGSVQQFFHNSSGDLAEEVVGAMRELGLEAHAAAVSRGVASFGDPYPVDLAARRARFHPPPSPLDSRGLDEHLDALTGEVDDGAIHAAMLRAAKDADILPR
jgi:hypothetical protein